MKIRRIVDWKGSSEDECSIWQGSRADLKVGPGKMKGKLEGGQISLWQGRALPCLLLGRPAWPLRKGGIPQKKLKINMLNYMINNDFHEIVLIFWIYSRFWKQIYHKIWRKKMNLRFLLFDLLDSIQGVLFHLTNTQ